VAVALALLGLPRFLLAMLVALVIGLETSQRPLSGAFLYRTVPHAHVTIIELLFALLVFAAAVEAGRRKELRPPAPFTIPLVLLTAAIVVGVTVGLAGGASVGDVFISIKRLMFLVLMPFVVLNVVRGIMGVVSM